MQITFIQNWFIQTSINYSDTSMFDICLLLRSVQVLRDVNHIMFLICVLQRLIPDAQFWI